MARKYNQSTALCHFSLSKPGMTCSMQRPICNTYCSTMLWHLPSSYSENWMMFVLNCIYFIEIISSFTSHVNLYSLASTHWTFNFVLHITCWNHSFIETTHLCFHLSLLWSRSNWAREESHARGRSMKTHLPWFLSLSPALSPALPPIKNPVHHLRLCLCFLHCRVW